MLEILANLDSELMAVGTRIFAAKEKLAADIRYEMRKSSSDEDEKETKKKDDTEKVETTSESNSADEEETCGCSYFELVRRKSEKIFAENRARIEKEEAERKRKAKEEEKAEAAEEKKHDIKEYVSTFEDLLTQISESEGGAVMVDTLLKDMAEISEDLKTFISKPKDERDKLLQQMKAAQNTQVNPPTQHVPDKKNVGMDYSEHVQGVSYGQQPTIPVQQQTINQPELQQGQVVTQEHLDAIGLAKTMNASAIPVSTEQSEKEKKKGNK